MPKLCKARRFSSSGEFDGGDNGEIRVANDEIDPPPCQFGQTTAFLTTAQLGQLCYADLSKDLHVGHGFAKAVIEDLFGIVKQAVLLAARTIDQACLRVEIHDCRMAAMLARLVLAGDQRVGALAIRCVAVATTQ